MTKNTKQYRFAELNPLTIILIYGIIGGLWVLLSDKLVFLLIQDESTLNQIGILKGWLYIAVTAGLLYLLIHRFEDKLRGAEAQRQETQRRLLTLMSNLPGIAYRCRNDDDWTMQLVSIGSQELTGYTPDELIDNQFVAYGQLIHPDDRSAVRHEIQLAMESRIPYQVAYRITTAGGQGRWVWEQGRGILSATGDIEAIEGFITDITELKQAQMSLVLANRTLEQRVDERTYEIERRRRVAEGLRNILAVLNSNLPLDKTLDVITEQAAPLLGSDAIAIYRLDSQSDMLAIETSRGMPDDNLISADIPPGKSALRKAIRERKPQTIEDVTTARGSLTSEETADEIPEYLGKQYRSLLAVPIVIRDMAFGGMVLYYRELRAFSEEDIALAMSFSDHVSLAIENARLLAAAEASAVVAERNRLARELHDAVTQTLFAATLIAEILPDIWAISPAEGRQRLGELRELTRGALAEMRSLLLELRPATLMEMPLGELLGELAEAMTARARIPIELDLIGEATLPDSIKIAFYRIAQEALNNVLKHAKATRATVTLHMESDQIELIIYDDGRGFDPKHIPPGHMGLGLMQERAAEAGMIVEIVSQPGDGTKVRSLWHQ